MVKVTYIEHDGTKHEVEGPVGETVMQVATDNMIDAIVAECGGCCACATCHCIVADEWADKLEAIDELEEDMLDGVLDRKPTSRLSCQITLTEELDGIVVHLPESQY